MNTKYCQIDLDWYNFSDIICFDTFQSSENVIYYLGRVDNLPRHTILLYMSMIIILTDNVIISYYNLTKE